MKTPKPAVHKVNLDFLVSVVIWKDKQRNKTCHWKCLLLITNIVKTQQLKKKKKEQLEGVPKSFNVYENYQLADTWLIWNSRTCGITRIGAAEVAVGRESGSGLCNTPIWLARPEAPRTCGGIHLRPLPLPGESPSPEGCSLEAHPLRILV